MARVSVIIPTTGRPALVLRAVSSALGQTHAELEVIVVVDGPNEATLQALAEVDDPRLRVIHRQSPLGAGAARNLGAAAAQYEWLAFLDDDDEWLPEKLERQLAVASVDETVLVTCRCRVVTGVAEYVWPRRLYDGREPVDEYLFGRRSFWRGEAYMATPTFLLPAHVFRRAQFGTSRQHEDTTLLLRVSKALGGRIVMVPEVLAVIHTEDRHASASSSFSWREAVDWLDGMGRLVTPRAYSGFCLVTVVSQAVRAGDYAAFWGLLGRAFRRGSPTLVQLALYLAFWTVPIGARQRLRAFVFGLAGRSPRRVPS